MPVEIGPDIYLIDCGMGGLPRQCGVFLIKGERNVLVDSGPSVTVENLVRELKKLGTGPEVLDDIILTHLHLDHAGGASVLARDYPRLSIHLWEGSARFLADPERMLASAARSLGAIAPHYGTLLSVPPERMKYLSDRQGLDLGGGRGLSVYHTPGHSEGHFAFLDSSSHALFRGDCLGHYLQADGYVFPATPAPEFDLERSVQSAKRLLELAPAVLFFSHFGSSADPAEVICSFISRLEIMIGLARSLKPAERTPQALGALFFADFPALSGDEAGLLKGILEVNAAGILRFVEKCGG